MDMDVAAEIQALKEENQELRDLIGALTVQVGCGISINAEIHDGEKVGRLSDLVKVATGDDGSDRLCLKLFTDDVGPSRYEGDVLTDLAAHVVDEVGNVAPWLGSVIELSNGKPGGVADWGF